MHPRPMFLYGTLYDADMRAAVLGRVIDPRAVMAAVAPGYRPVVYPGRTYPALVRAPGVAASGHAVLCLSAFEVELLDAFEGPEYVRALVPVIVDGELHEADAYLPSVALPASAPAWSLEDWQRTHKAAALIAERATAAELRTRLIAVRPN